ncbi:MAG: hypothetical protein KF777_04580 [Planctomycetaceae bacterium]|nr:hypothetical protein [Planctomycetaceae bacterium]
MLGIPLDSLLLLLAAALSAISAPRLARPRIVLILLAIAGAALLSLREVLHLPVASAAFTGHGFALMLEILLGCELIAARRETAQPNEASDTPRDRILIVAVATLAVRATTAWEAVFLFECVAWVDVLCDSAALRKVSIRSRAIGSLLMAWGVLLAFLAAGPAGAALSAVAVLAAVGQPLGVFPWHQTFVDRFAARPGIPRWSATIGLRACGVLALLHVSSMNPGPTAWPVLLVVLAGWTLGTAAVSTLDQPRWRRVLAAWMQAHSGWLLLAIAAGMGTGSGEGSLALTTPLNLVLHSMIAHVLAVMLLIVVVPASPRGGFPEFRDDFVGWYLGQPIAAVGVILAGASLAGLPGTVGGDALRQIWEACLALCPIAGDNIAERSSLLLVGAIVSGLTVPVFLVPVADLARRLFWEIPPVSREPSSRFVTACRMLMILLVLAGGWLPKGLLFFESSVSGGGNAAGVSKPIPLDRDDIALPPPRRPLARHVISPTW